MSLLTFLWACCSPGTAAISPRHGSLVFQALCPLFVCPWCGPHPVTRTLPVSGPLWPWSPTEVPTAPAECSRLGRYAQTTDSKDLSGGGRWWGCERCFLRLLKWNFAVVFVCKSDTHLSNTQVFFFSLEALVQINENTYPHNAFSKKSKFAKHYVGWYLSPLIHT